MEPASNDPTQNNLPPQPAGFENWSLDQKQAWKDLENARANKAEAEVEQKKSVLFSTGTGHIMVNPLSVGLSLDRSKTFKKFDDIQTNKKEASDSYEIQKLVLAEKIRETLQAEGKSESEINDAIFEKLVVQEHSEYIKALREARGVTLAGKALEGAKNLLGTKAVKWYLGLDPKQRRALNLGVGAAAGLAFSASIAPGALGTLAYVGSKVARAGFSGLAGTKAGEWANKKWSIEELIIEHDRKIEELKNSGLSLEDQSAEMAKIEEQYRKDKIKMTAKKVGTTVAAGAGTGILTGLLEHGVAGIVNFVNSPTESNVSGGRVGSITDNKFPVRRGYESPIKQAEEANVVRPGVLIEKLPENGVIKPLNESVAAVEELKPESIFGEPSVLKHEWVAGDSTWKTLDNALENNAEFKELTEAQKTFVLSAYTNKALANPADYGLNEDGGAAIGQKTDFTKLFEDGKEFKSILKKAQETILPDSPQETSILQNNEKILTWVKAHPTEEITPEKVTEILNTEVQTDAPVPEEVPNESINKIQEFGRELEKIDRGSLPISLQQKINQLVEQKEAMRIKAVEIGKMNKDSEEFLKESISIHQQADKFETELRGLIEQIKNQSIEKPKVEYFPPDLIKPSDGVELAGGAGVATMALAGAPKFFGNISRSDREKVLEEIGLAKQRLAELEGGKLPLANVMPINSGMHGLDKVKPSVPQEVWNVYNANINQVYAKRGLFGKIKIEGVNTPEWAFMNNLKAKEVLQYARKDSEKSKLSWDVKKTLDNSKQHQEFIANVLDLMEKDGRDFLVSDTENMGDFFLRLEDHVRRNYLKKAA